jgi:hypothetical protein
VPSAGTLPGIPTDAWAYAYAPIGAPAGAAASQSQPQVQPPPSPTVVITVDKGSQRMSVRVNGVQKWNWAVSTGRRGYATPRGTFKPIYMARHHRSREWNNAPMPHSIFYTSRGHAIHGSDAVGRLGAPASHGCVRLAPSNARQLFALVQQHGVARTQVVITGAERAPNAVARTKAAPQPQASSRAQAKVQPRPAPRQATPQRLASQPTLAARPVNLAP